MKGLIHVTITANRKHYDVYISCEIDHHQVEVLDKRHIIVYCKNHVVIKERCREGYQMFLKIKKDGVGRLMFEFKEDMMCYNTSLWYREDAERLNVSIDCTVPKAVCKYS